MVEGADDLTQEEKRIMMEFDRSAGFSFSVVFI